MVWKLILGGAVGFGGMEIVGWAIHKYLRHGPLWFIHRTHHRPSGHGLEWNDLFSLVFGGWGVFLLLGALEPWQPWRMGAGVGVCLYGLFYFVLHDAWVHRRWVLPKPFDSVYLQAMIRAHRAHHAGLNAKPSESYGLWLFPRRFWYAKTKNP
ncbi:MAG: fatty acid hydroxylase [Bacteroidota bacterium]